MQLSATIERSEKQIILARHARRLLNLLDDKPLVPGEARPEYENSDAARRVLNDAERDLRDWRPSLEPIQTSANSIGPNLIPETADTVDTTEDEMYDAGIPSTMAQEEDEENVAAA